MKLKFIASIASALLLLCPERSFAGDNVTKELTVLENTLRYVHGIKEHGSSVIVALLHDPDSSKSQAEMKAFLEQSKNKSADYRGTLTMHPLSIKELGTAGDDFSFVYVTDDLAGSYSPIEAFSKQHHLFVIGNDKQCAEENVCVIAISTENGVNIYLSEKALNAAGFTVDPFFRLMVKSL